MYVLEKRDGHPGEYMQLADSRKVEITPGQILAELAIKGKPKVDRMSTVVKFDHKVLDTARKLWKDVQDHGVENSTELATVVAASSGVKRKEGGGHMVLSKAKIGKGADGNNTMIEYFLNEVPAHYRGQWEKDIRAG